MRCRKFLMWSERGAARPGSGEILGAVTAGMLFLIVGSGGAAYADERPREPKRLKEPAWSHTNQDNLVPPPNVIVDHTNQDKKEEPKEPGGEGDEEKKHNGFALPSDPQRPLHLLMQASPEPYLVLPIHLVAGAPVHAPLNVPIASAMSGDSAAASDFVVQMIPGPGALAPLVIAALLGGRRRRRHTARGRTDS